MPSNHSTERAATITTGAYQQTHRSTCSMHTIIEHMQHIDPHCLHPSICAISSTRRKTIQRAITGWTQLLDHHKRRMLTIAEHRYSRTLKQGLKVAGRCLHAKRLSVDCCINSQQVQHHRRRLEIRMNKQAQCLMILPSTPSVATYRSTSINVSCNTQYV